MTFLEREALQVDQGESLNQGAGGSSRLSPFLPMLVELMFIVQVRGSKPGSRHRFSGVTKDWGTKWRIQIFNL